ncbi:hypothetical protein [Roseicyclus marinus]|uniref:hypothetical protein n=1 Tax=Roseicyclus marinus TaxID=2161673 RepID=UPI00240F4F8B|nr:hypothetical protein [Roseicyclus marinus]
MTRFHHIGCKAGLSQEFEKPLRQRAGLEGHSDHFTRGICFNAATSSCVSLAAVISLTILPCADTAQIAVVASETSSPIYTSTLLPFRFHKSFDAPHRTTPRQVEQRAKGNDTSPNLLD